MQNAIEIKLILNITSIHFLHIAIYIYLISHLQIVFTSILYSRIYLEKYFLHDNRFWHVAQMQNISRLLTSIYFNFDIGFNIQIVNLVFFHLQLLLLFSAKKENASHANQMYQLHVNILCVKIVTAMASYLNLEYVVIMNS